MTRYILVPGQESIFRLEYNRISTDSSSFDSLYDKVSSKGTSSRHREEKSFMSAAIMWRL